MGILFGTPARHGEAEDRALALAECLRVLRPGGVVYAAAISRYLELLELGTSGRLTSDLRDGTAALIVTGTYDGHVGFVAGHWHTADEPEAELRSSGFREVTVHGIEGPAWPTLDAVGEGEFEARRDAALRCA